MHPMKLGMSNATVSKYFKNLVKTIRETHAPGMYVSVLHDGVAAAMSGIGHRHAWQRLRGLVRGGPHAEPLQSGSCCAPSGELIGPSLLHERSPRVQAQCSPLAVVRRASRRETTRTSEMASVSAIENCGGILTS